MAIEPGDLPGYRDMRETGERLYVAPHIRIEKGQGPAIVYPAKAIMFGMTKTEGTGDTLHPQLCIYALAGGLGLSFLPNADELEALGEAMQKMAADMRADANAQLAATLAKGKPAA